MKDEKLTWIFIVTSFIFVIIGIVRNDFFWFIRAGIVLTGGIVYYFLVKNKVIGKRRKGR